MVLLFSAARLLFRRGDQWKHRLLGSGGCSRWGGLGFLAGLAGTGGGIFLTPLLFCEWARIREATAVSALFIWVNSIAGLVGYFTKVHSIPSLGFILVAAIVGGIIGSHLGSNVLQSVISLCLATVL